MSSNPSGNAYLIFKRKTTSNFSLFSTSTNQHYYLQIWDLHSELMIFVQCAACFYRLLTWSYQYNKYKELSCGKIDKVPHFFQTCRYQNLFKYKYYCFLVLFFNKIKFSNLNLKWLIFISFKTLIINLEDFFIFLPWQQPVQKYMLYAVYKYADLNANIIF